MTWSDHQAMNNTRSSQPVYALYGFIHLECPIIGAKTCRERNPIDAAPDNPTLSNFTKASGTVLQNLALAAFKSLRPLPGARFDKTVVRAMNEDDRVNPHPDCFDGLAGFLPMSLDESTAPNDDGCPGRIQNRVRPSP